MTEEFIGRIVNVVYDKKQMVMSDKDGILQMFSYPDALDLTAKKQKQGWFVKLTLDGKMIKNIAYADKPAWAGKPRTDYQKKDEGLILKEVLYKALCDLYIETANLDEVNFDIAAEAVIRKMEEHYPRVLKAGDALLWLA
jgi:hypothetical protein